ncbi:MAG TPA: response regulator [Polyangiales bacterium]|jgi:CheY-like chemotaxis protein
MKRSTVMVVENDAKTRKALRQTLEKASYKVLEAADARNAHLLAVHHMPQLVLQDLMLPDSTAFLFSRELRALPGGDTVPIIAMSKIESHLADARISASGFAAFLFLPIDPTMLLRTVQACLPAEEGTVHKPGGNLRVLVLDDNAIQRQLLSLYLREWGFVPVTVDSLEAALAEVRTTPVDAVVCDVLMPKRDGFECCRLMRAEPSLSGKPIVLVSAATPEDDDYLASRAAGATAMLMGVPNFWGLRELLLRSLSGAPPVMA